MFTTTLPHTKTIGSLVTVVKGLANLTTVDASDPVQWVLILRHLCVSVALEFILHVCIVSSGIVVTRGLG